MGPFGTTGGAVGGSEAMRMLGARQLEAPDVSPGYGASTLTNGQSVHAAVCHLEESLEALQKVLTELGDRLNAGGVLAPLAAGPDTANKGRPSSCGLEERISVIRARVDRLASATVSVVQALQV